MKLAAVLDLADATAVEVVGGKAANLGELIRAGFDVPAGVVLPARLADAALPAAVDEALGRLNGDRFAVRSSGIAEDMAAASFAGQYETYLGVTREGVVAAVRGCRDSGAAHRVAAYREKQRINDAPSVIAVIVQELVDAVAAGVAFSADPLTGVRDRVLVSAVKGLGERLVSGQTTADEWSIEAGNATCRARPEGAIDANTALSIAALARAAADHFGAPQDIEWALDREGRLFLLQARPITALPDEVRWEPPDGSSYLRNFRLGEWFFEPLTPLFDEWLVRRLEAREFELMHRWMGIPVRDHHHALVNGWYFMDVGFMPDSPRAMIRMFLRHILPRAIRSPRRAAMMMPPFVPFAIPLYYEEWRQRIQPAHRRLVDESRQRIERADSQELIAIVDQLADDAGEYFAYIACVGGYAWKSELKLAEFCRAHLEGSGLTSHQELLLACREPDATLHKVISLDWYRPMLIETEPSQSADEAFARHRRLLSRRQEAESTARAALAGRHTLLRRFEALLSVAQQFASVREEQISELTMGWPVLRLALRRLGEHLAERKVLADPDEIFFLTRDEVASARDDLTAEAGVRLETWQRQRLLTPPLNLGPERVMLRRMMDDHVKTFRARGQAGGVELLRGMPSSPGIAQGRVRVVAGPERFDDFEKGEVLVAQATTPGWTPLFARAAAVVTDTGSVMAHASLVAREYGIPAVVGTGEATRKLRDGMLVTVDGSAGVVLQAR
ncbi:MAG TPA: PEP/pyruvate-binding domain-containing protein [Candidatus Dormibacteraeota bacterium]